jgi:tetratricopeptide (TPR) repeat protein
MNSFQAISANLKQTVLTVCIAAAVAVVNVEAQMRTMPLQRNSDLIISDEGWSPGLPMASLLEASDLGVRYLKLGDTYREARKYDMAQEYIQRGFDLVRGRGSRYWEAVAYEYWGMVERDMGNRLNALEYLRRAETLYRRALSPVYLESSIDAVGELIRDTQRDLPMDVLYRPGGQMQPQSRTYWYGQSTAADVLSANNQVLREMNTRLRERVVRLEDRIRTLETQGSR